ncbi:hypothetical protein GCM10011344_37210 [Dokdonia pacifica]|uniref:Uncharacterized protein n=1 Tax=Dokdonia pacifica TaxID=1627892 RepID=A0A239B0X4_9FLAO|nr:hypothetical protein [Dokdonia pacifica]GGG32823.1 hypothetical protein GCM10011344_37210 [Dokdonia pacifica]SNS01507.1 hypothetical protein SAMN06265376_105268 [Dokdonia pacifica]
MKQIVLTTSILLFSLIRLPLYAQEVDSKIEILPVTIQQEATSIWRTINDITFFEKQGYTIHLPDDQQIDSLIMKSKKGTFGNEDFEIIYNLLETNIFDKRHYIHAIKKIREQEQLINSLLHQIESKKKNWDWKFNTFKTYKIILTLYGTGGSYNADEGTITLLTTKKGDFMNYQNPANTIIHEITHIGMEYPIVQKHKLSHGNKERIVDTFVYLMFKEDLPNYKIQQMGDQKMDSYLSEPKKINSLDTIISKFFK